MGKITHDEVVGALKEVYDPEIPVNIVDLGLIYNMEYRKEKTNLYFINKVLNREILI